MNSENWLEQLYKNKMQYKQSLPNWLLFSLIIISFLGFMDASYLTIQHFTGATLNCSIIKGCDVVTSSKYSQIFGIPIALFGLLYYLTILIGTLIYYDTRNIKIIKVIQPLTVLGFLFSGWLIYAMFFLIKALCQYCLLSALTSTLLFIFGLFTLKYKKK